MTWFGPGAVVAAPASGSCQAPVRPTRGFTAPARRDLPAALQRVLHVAQEQFRVDRLAEPTVEAAALSAQIEPVRGLTADRENLGAGPGRVPADGPHRGRPVTARQ